MNISKVCEIMYYESGGWTMGVNENNAFKENVSYDKNGNILTMNRTGELVSGQPIQIDELAYTYTANQLQTVTDATNSTAGFNDGNKVGVDYTYDAFGNLKTDKNKGITNITYNHLNLPVAITFATGTITYTYDATGTKVKKVVQPNSGVAQTTDYLFGFEYENGTLQTFPHAEGNVKNNAGNYVYHYIYKDHLGNNRLVYADFNNDGTINTANEIVEENNYYPFGLKHEGYNNLAGAGYKYKLNGKEYEDSFGLNIYEMDLRQLDPAIGRWLVQDPVVHHDYSPYSAFDNNPVYWSDPSGADSQKNITIADLFNKAKSGVTSFDFVDGELVAESFSKTLETSLEQSYLFLDAPEEGGGGGNGNGGGDQQPKNNSSYRNYKDWYQKVLQHKFLNNFNFDDAIYHYNFGKGESVTVNLNTLNFDGITVDRFRKSKQFHEGYPKIVVNFLGSDYKGFRKEQGLIYGNITLVYIGNNKIMALTDQYNFEMHKAEITKRNVLTFAGSMYNGAGTPYYINFQGTAIIKNK